MVFSKLVRGAGAAVLTLAVSWTNVLAPSFVRADEAVRTTTSLGLAPEGAAFYASVLRNREQWDAFTQTKAFAKLSELPLVQLGVALVKAQWNNPADENPQLQAFKEFVTAPENGPLLEMLADLVSNEMFVYGDKGLADQLAVVNELNRTVRKAQAEAIRNGQFDEANPAKEMLTVLLANSERIAIPDLVVGFRVKDVARAKTQLARLEQLAMAAAQFQPMLMGRVKKEKIGAGEYLTVSLDGTLIPWDEVQEPAVKSDPRWGEFVEKFQKKTAVIALGVHEEYVIFSIGDNAEHLANLGKGKLLVDQPEFAPLLKGPARRLTNIGFVNKDFLGKVSNPADQVDDMVASLESMLPLLPGPDETKQELVKDLKTLSGSIRQMTPEPKSFTGFRYQTPRGYETMTYSWGGAKDVDASGPLTVLQHVGANPIMFSAGHLSPKVRDLDMMGWLIERGVYYAEQFYLANLPVNDQAQYRQIKQVIEPIVKQFGTTTRETLVPAMAGGQVAVVVDAETQHKQWHQAMPESSAALPLPAPAIVVQVQDTAPLKKAGAEYLATAQALVAKLSELFPGQIPPIPLAAPQSRDFPSGTIHYYSLPEEAGLARFVAPNAGLSKTVAVFSLLPQQSRRLLEPTTATQEGPLAQASKNAVVASKLNFPALIDVIDVWTKYIVNEAGAGNDATAGVMPQIDSIFAVLKCWKGVASVTYVEGNDLVTHTESRYEDLPE